MGNSCTIPKTEESSFGFAFNSSKFSDRILKLEILPPDDHDSESNSNFKEHHFHTHALLLAARSPFFRKLLDNGMKESQHKATLTLRIKASEEAAVMDLLSFMYDNPLMANSEAELLDVLIVADKYELPSMVFVSEEFKPLLDQVKNYLASHFKDFTKSQQYAAMELPLSAIEAVLGGGELQVDSENDIFCFAVRWARLHYPNLEERRKIMTNRLAPLICFENMSSSKLKSIAEYTDFEREKIMELVINALSCKLEAPYRREITTFPTRVYNKRLVKVVHLDLARCAVYLDLTKEDCADICPQKKLLSQTFCVGGESFYLSAQRQLEKGTLGLFVYLKQGSRTCTLDVRFSAMKKLSKEFTSLCTFVHVYEENKGVGCWDAFKTQWKEFVGDKSEYFIDGILHLRADITFIK